MWWWKLYTIISNAEAPRRKFYIHYFQVLSSFRVANLACHLHNIAIIINLPISAQKSKGSYVHLTLWSRTKAERKVSNNSILPPSHILCQPLNHKNFTLSLIIIFLWHQHRHRKRKKYSSWRHPWCLYVSVCILHGHLYKGEGMFITWREKRNPARRDRSIW